MYTDLNPPLPLVDILLWMPTACTVQLGPDKADLAPIGMAGFAPGRSHPGLVESGAIYWNSLAYVLPRSSNISLSPLSKQRLPVNFLINDDAESDGESWANTAGALSSPHHSRLSTPSDHGAEVRPEVRQKVSGVTLPGFDDIARLAGGLLPPPPVSPTSITKVSSPAAPAPWSSFYRENLAIPVTDPNGDLMFDENGEQIVQVSKVRDQPKKIGLLDRYPDRALDYTWVEFKDKQRVWHRGSRHKAQIAAAKLRQQRRQAYA
ncbi:unnamed protein product [Parascedosporium putredinis]|uniref:Uncharacterized protein n=1 Tax=Parascedosporium putredinis TaxID=1442378 RepID=A0A9P1H8N6_9PEZI|nr:unnamed protein product [Parascedosporium putredinis]CAI8000913.1 unnamed protein product [Parascedosporium putredinis]